MAERGLCVNTVMMYICFKRLFFFFQGVPGPSGPRGAKGITGEPVSVTNYLHEFFHFEDTQCKLTEVSQLPKALVNFVSIFFRINKIGRSECKDLN